MDRVRYALAPFDLAVDQRLATQISRYVDTLLFWNQKVSLTTITAPDEILSRHFGESMFGARLLDPEDATLCDVGSGAGFPGLALKLILPRLHVRLVEPVMKKAVFLSEVVRILDLANVEVIRARIEDIGGLKTDVMTARAVGSTELLLKTAEANLSARGRVLLWLGAEDASLAQHVAGWGWKDPIRVPNSRSRVILSGTPSR